MNSPIVFLPATLKVVVLSRNRLEYLIQSLQSVIESAKNLPACINFRLEISDNSDDERVIESIKKQYPQVSISLRRPNITVINHFKTVLHEANAEYLVMFHDDDLMKPNFLPKLYSLLILNPEVAAVGCNAYYMKNNIDTKYSFINTNETKILVNNSIKLLDSYFLIGKRGTSPFPGYMYRVKYIDDAFIDEAKGGIHADLSFLLDIIQRGSILITTEILMSYRLHETNVNNDTTVRIQRDLLRYLKTKIPIKKSQALQDLRYTIMIRWFREQSIKISDIKNWTYRQKIILKYIIEINISGVSGPN